MFSRRHIVLCAILVVAGCGAVHGMFGGEAARGNLAGAWRSQVQFSSGSFAGIGDLQFIYVFNEGGTLTESSNYDGAPPVPPAYGVWRKLAPRAYEARYEFYLTKAPAKVEDLARGGGWLPAGRGVLNESITLSDDGQSFTSKIKYQGLDALGKPTSDTGEAEGQGVRIEF
jgi:hypothetical protein